MGLSFGGVTYDEERDGPRLRPQLDAVRRRMSDGQWHTLAQLSRALASDGITAPQASVSARLRDLRKPQFGGYIIDREYVSDGLWRYRMSEPEAS